MIIDKQGNEYFPMKLDQIPNKKEEDIWIALDPSFNRSTIVRLDFSPEHGWEPLEMGYSRFLPPDGSEFIFLKQVKLPEFSNE